jgi:hypothetical protein
MEIAADNLGIGALPHVPAKWVRFAGQGHAET